MGDTVKLTKFAPISEAMTDALSGHAIKVFAKLYLCATGWDSGFPVVEIGTRRLAEKCEMSRETISKCIAELEVSGYLVIVSKDTGLRSSYRLMVDRSDEQPAGNSDRPKFPTGLKNQPPNTDNFDDFGEVGISDRPKFPTGLNFRPAGNSDRPKFPTTVSEKSLIEESSKAFKERPLSEKPLSLLAFSDTVAGNSDRLEIPTGLENRPVGISDQLEKAKQVYARLRPTPVLNLTNAVAALGIKNTVASGIGHAGSNGHALGAPGSNGEVLASDPPAEILQAGESDGQLRAEKLARFLLSLFAGSDAAKVSKNLADQYQNPPIAEFEKIVRNLREWPVLSESTVKTLFDYAQNLMKCDDKSQADVYTNTYGTPENMTKNKNLKSLLNKCAAKVTQ